MFLLFQYLVLDKQTTRCVAYSDINSRLQLVVLDTTILLQRSDLGPVSSTRVLVGAHVTVTRKGLDNYCFVAFASTAEAQKFMTRYDDQPIRECLVGTVT